MRLIDCDNVKIPKNAPYKATIKRILDLQPTVKPNQWIPCSERLPDEDDCLKCYVTCIIFGNLRTFEMTWSYGKWYWKNGKGISKKYTIIAWMNYFKPQPYKD